MRLRDGPLGTSHATAWAPPWVCFLRSILLPTITSHRTEITRFGDPFTSLARIAGHEGPPVQRVAASRGPRTDSRHSLIKFVEEPGLIAFERYKPLALRSLLSSLDLLKRTNCLLRAGVDKKKSIQLIMGGFTEETWTDLLWKPRNLAFLGALGARIPAYPLIESVSYARATLQCICGCA